MPGTSLLSFLPSPSCSLSALRSPPPPFLFYPVVPGARAEGKENIDSSLPNSLRRWRLGSHQPQFSAALVCSGGRNRIPQAARLKQQRFLFLQFWRLEVQDKMPTGVVPGKSLLPSDRQSPLTVSSLALPLCIGMTGPSLPPYKDTSPIALRVSLACLM